jgi:hypothetical protein
LCGRAPLYPRCSGIHVKFRQYIEFVSDPKATLQIVDFSFDFSPRPVISKSVMNKNYVYLYKIMPMNLPWPAMMFASKVPEMAISNFLLGA